MKKFLIGVASTLGVIGLSKLAYKKGRKDQAETDYKYLSDTIDTTMKGIDIGRKQKEEKESE